MEAAWVYAQSAHAAESSCVHAHVGLEPWGLSLSSGRRGEACGAPVGLFRQAISCQAPSPAGEILFKNSRVVGQKTSLKARTTCGV